MILFKPVFSVTCVLFGNVTTRAFSLQAGSSCALDVNAMGNRSDRNHGVGELQEIGAVLESCNAETSEVRAKIKSILDEVRSIKGQGYEQVRRLRFCVATPHAV